jgi:predicted Zn-dependent protease
MSFTTAAIFFTFTLALQPPEGPSVLDAIQALAEKARESPADAGLQHELGALYASIGRIPQAADALARAVELAPEEPSYAFAYGELLYRMGRTDDALPHLERGSSLPECLLILAGAQERLGRGEDALATLETYVEKKPEDEGVRLLLAGKLEQAKRIEDALGVYRAGLALDPENAVLLGRVAEILSRDHGNYAEAEERARRSLASDPDLVESRLVLARILGRTGREEEALAELERARERDTDAAEVHYQLAQAYQKAGRSEEAKSAAARFQELSARKKREQEKGARVAVTYKKASELLQRGSMLEAEKVFLEVLDVDPENVQARSMLAKIAFSKNDASAAARWIEEALAIDAGISELHYLRALFAARSGRPDEAEGSVRRSLELDPAFPEAWSLLGSLLLDSKRAEEALVCFSRAAALDPRNAATQLNLASAHAALGNAGEEERAMARYRELSERR